MSDVLMFADTLRSKELRHEVPLALGDPIGYAERDGRRHVLAPTLEFPRLEAAGLDAELHPLEEYGWDDLVRSGMPTTKAQYELTLRMCRDLGIDRAVVPGTFPVALADLLRSQGVEVTPDQELFDGRRRVKNAHELAGIRRAQAAAQAGMATVARMLRESDRGNGTLTLDGEPLTCERVKAEVERAFADHGAGVEAIIVSHGAQSAIGHDEGSGPIAPGETVVADLFPFDRKTGCWADMTRTFVVGEPTDEAREWHRLSLEALRRSLAAIRPGVEGREVHRVACEVFQEHGYPTQLTKQPGEVLLEGFYHSLGHGVGLEVHEEPGLSRNGQELVAGDVLAVEPGLYRQGVGGCRLEDLVLVTEDGCENLTDFPYDLEP
ncbi:MAG TPA: Xaa-Pro peptidase family protein [Gaiellaceae bacterium]|nr:Xaa-Pro peptidase family protein [Gaiellaceae bacterium]